MTTLSRHPWRPHGFTLIELLVVIGIICLLLSILGTALAKIRERTRVSRSRTLIQKLYSGMELYHLQTRTYPPLTTPGGLTGSQALYWFLTTPFRTTPNAAKGELWADLNIGPCANFEENEIVANGAGTDIIDAWNTPVQFKMNVLVDDLGIPQNSPLIYSCGVNKQDEHIVLRPSSIPGMGTWATTTSNVDLDYNSDDLTVRGN